jgi:uncharacterized protein YjbI with pentapeptide repeats
LFAAFYFKAAEDRSRSENAFEFTHKSFGEYLTALRLVREVLRVDKGLRQSPEFMTEDSALRDWCRLTSPRAMSTELLRFLRDELALRHQPDVAFWQETLTRLFNRNLKNGPPIDSFENKSFRLIEQKARNAEETLLAALNACARFTRTVTRVAWNGVEGGRGHRPSAGGPPFTVESNVVHRLRGQRWPPETCVALQCLGWLDWTGSNLVVNDLYTADLAHSILAGASLIKTELGYANLKWADLSGANLHRAALNGADLSQADLSRARLSQADLTRAQPKGARLHGASLGGADLSGSDLSEAEGLQQDQLERVWGDEDTKLPEGLTIRRRRDKLL